MITILVGENSFEVERAIKQIASEFNGVAERIDGSVLELRQLPDLLMGVTLFAERRLVIIKNLAENTAVWPFLPEWLARVSDDITLLLVEEKLDKRTKTYKDLQKNADIREFKAWGERDGGEAEKWLLQEAKTLGIALDKMHARLVVNRVGVDQWLLHSALQKLMSAGELSTELIENSIDANPAENVFDLLDAALRGNTRKVQTMIANLELTEDPYRLFGLLSGQVFQLAVLSVAELPSAEVAKDIGVHPYGLTKLLPYAKDLGRGGVKKIVAAFAGADSEMKTSAAEPWLLIERALLITATR
jgi:DNA polymerase-3 subunit delta